MHAETKIKWMNDLILKYEEEGNAVKLKPFLAPTFRILRSTGVIHNQQEFLETVPSNANRRRHADEPRLILGDSHALYTCIIITTQNPDGTPNAGRFWNARVFVLESGEWYCALWQVIRLSL